MPPWGAPKGSRPARDRTDEFSVLLTHGLEAAVADFSAVDGGALALAKTTPLRDLLKRAADAPPAEAAAELGEV